MRRAMDENTFGIRDGEVAVDLPDTFDASLYFIGRIRTPWKERKDCPKNARESDAVCTIEVDPRWAPALKDVETCSHVVVLYWMDRSRRDLVLQVPRHYGDRSSAPSRCARRPGPTRSPCPSPGWSGSRARGFRWSASTASTAPRSSTSSPISPRPTRCRMPRWAGMRPGRAEPGIAGPTVPSGRRRDRAWCCRAPQLVQVFRRKYRNFSSLTADREAHRSVRFFSTPF